MADITMCIPKNCTLKDRCYRVSAKKNPYAQSFFTDEPFDILKETCAYFWSRVPNSKGGEN